MLVVTNSVDIMVLESDLQKVRELIRFEDLRERTEELESLLTYRGWTDVETVQELSKCLITYNTYIDLWNRIEELKNFIVLIAEADPKDDMESLFEEVKGEETAIREALSSWLLELQFSGKYDRNNAILSIHAGSGGKEAQDWASMLYRMYMRWAAANKYKCELIDLTEGEFPGSIKTCVIEIKGKNAYGMLKSENGVHRLVRVSPFDSQNRRHTSFAAIEVIPEIELDATVELDMKDIRVDTFRSSGKGGQHVNKTESAIRLTHIPTGIVVECQQERSQHQNKDYAMKVLLSKLTAIKEQEHYDEISDIQGEQSKIEWGSQIRSYVFMPYQLVKDHRTGYETSNINAVMDGEINEFIYKYLAK